MKVMNGVKQSSIIEKLFFILSITILLLINSNFALVIGIDNRRTVAIFPILIYILYKAFIGKFKMNKIDVITKVTICLGILATIVLSMFPHGDFKFFLTFSVTPFLVYAYLEQMSEWEHTVLRFCMFFLLWIEVGMAVYERYTYSILIDVSENLIGFDSSGENWTFRSQALFGHSLANSFIVSTINIFILASNRVSNRNKYISFFLSFIAILCFNSRGNIIVMSLVSVPFLYSAYKNGNRKFKLVTWIFVVLLIYFIVRLQDFGLGGRLFNNALGTDDSSTMARLVAFDVFDFLNMDVLLWGQDIDSYLLVVNSHTDASFVENSFIAILLRYGLVFGIPTLIMFVWFQYTRLSTLIKWKRLLILFSYYIVGFTNPHLMNPIQWMVFFFSCYAFVSSPIINRKNRNFRYCMKLNIF